MNTVLKEGLDVFYTVFLDDILVFSRSVKDHATHLRWVFGKLQENGLKAKAGKCSFGITSVEYLGHVIYAQGVSLDSSKVEAIKSWPPPKDAYKVSVFLELANYYSQMVQGFAMLAAPMSALLRKGIKFIWFHKCLETFS